MLYLVRVGKNTPKGKFKELYRFSVSTKYSGGTVKENYEAQYEGFVVKVEMPHELILRNEEVKPESQNFLTDVLVDYTDGEREIAELLHRYESEADQLRHELYEKITERYRNLSYTDIGSDTKLLLIYTHNEEAWIRKLPIHGAVFAQYVSKGQDLTNKQEDANATGDND